MGKGNRIKEFIIDQDIYGHAIGVHYRGSTAYKTFLGSFCTLGAYLLVILQLVLLVTVFIDGSNQTEKTQENALDRFFGGPRKFSEYNLDLIVYSVPPISPDIGRFKVEQNLKTESGS